VRKKTLGGHNFLLKDYRGEWMATSTKGSVCLLRDAQFADDGVGAEHPGVWLDVTVIAVCSSC
jgi:hypothetical protein